MQILPVQVMATDKWTRPRRGRPLLLPGAEGADGSRSWVPVKTEIRCCTCDAGGSWNNLASILYEVVCREGNAL